MFRGEQEDADRALTQARETLERRETELQEGMRELETR